MDHHSSLGRFQSRKKRQGFAIILTALMLTIILPMVGLVIDVGLMYAIRARLASACDAAALAAARSLAVGVTLADQETSARARATAFFEANFPTGTFESSARNISVQIDESVAQTRTVTVTGTAEAPVYFMKMLGVPKTTVGASGAAARRDVNVILVLDRSSSLELAHACDDVEAAATSFTSLFANQRDRMGMITFGGSYRLDYAPTKYFKQSPALTSQISLLDPGGCQGFTGSAQALWKGYEQLAALNEPGALNALVFFTDGQPTAVTAQFRVKTVATPESSSKSRCYDWTHNLNYTSPSWNPLTQEYVGFVGSVGSPEGLYQVNAPAMPVNLTSERTYVTNPVGYTGAAKNASSDCRYRSGGTQVIYDLPYYPNNDYYGNSLFGYRSVSTYPAGHPYAGKVKLDDANTENVAVNAVDNAAQRIRRRDLNSSIPINVYVVGLGGAGQAEHALLKRIANTKDSSAFDSSAPTGLYLFAPSAANLSLAFSQIGSEILRLSK